MPELGAAGSLRAMPQQPLDRRSLLAGVGALAASCSSAGARAGERVRIAFGSCADERKFPELEIFTRIRERRPRDLVLLGDTPYIDSLDVGVRRARYAAFFEHPQVAATLAQCALHVTWDDHDYAVNDAFGAVAGREGARATFVERHGAGPWGEHGQGIYTSFRRGEVEVFLLDTRWFADCEVSPFDAARKTLLGAQQWAWLQRGLERSTARFKVLASGMIWNDAVRPAKLDYWGHWPHEREALFAWIAERGVRGVVLVGGDIHRTRVVQHAAPAALGYDLVELITSPLANSVIAAAAAPHPGLRFDAGVEQSALLLEHDPQNPERLRCEFFDQRGVLLHRETLRA